VAEPIASANIRWFTEAEGGRKSPPGSGYASTALFDAAPELSIVIWFEEGTASTAAAQPAEIGFLAPEVLADAVAPGQSFIVREGERKVAVGTVTAVWRHP
jgi:translation elongation factor EF-Tu-like GTPase